MTDPSLQDWFNEHYLTDAADERVKSLIWGQAARQQIMDFRDDIHPVLVNTYEARKAHPITVVSTHRSKSCELPVYFVDAKQKGIKLWARGNFYNWQVSVESVKPVKDVFFRLFTREPEPRDLNPVYFEGFKDEWVFEPYAENQQRFSVTLGYRLPMMFTFAFLLGESALAPSTSR